MEVPEVAFGQWILKQVNKQKRKRPRSLNFIMMWEYIKVYELSVGTNENGNLRRFALPDSIYIWSAFLLLLYTIILILF